MEFRKLFSGYVVSALLVWLVGSVLLAVGVALYLRQFEATEAARAFAETQAEARFAGHALLRTIDGMQAVHDLLRVRQAALHRNDGAAAADIEQHLRELVAHSRLGIVQVGVIDLSGMLTWGTGTPSSGVFLRDREHIRVHLGPNPGPALFISAPLMGRTSNRMSIQVSARILDPEARFAGVGVVSLDPYVLSESLGDEGTTPSGIIVVRRMSDGALLARSQDPHQHLQRAPVPDHPVVLAARTERSGNITYAATLDGRRVFASFYVPGNVGVVVTAMRNVDEALQLFHRVRLVSLVAMTIGILLGLVAALYWADRRRMLRQLEDAASRDPLTGLHNRRSFEIEAERALEHQRRHGGHISFLLADMDHFKAINDRFGHTAGDQVLRDVGELLSQGVRRSDIVCRWGGEEIVLMLQNCPGALALDRAERLRHAVQALYPREGQDVPGLSISIGIALVPVHGTRLDEVMREADNALYCAKRQGRNAVVMLPPREDEPDLLGTMNAPSGAARESLSA